MVYLSAVRQGLLLNLNEGSDLRPFHFDLDPEECLIPLFNSENDQYPSTVTSQE